MHQVTGHGQRKINECEDMSLETFHTGIQREKTMGEKKSRIYKNCETISKAVTYA